MIDNIVCPNCQADNCPNNGTCIKCNELLPIIDLHHKTPNNTEEILKRLVDAIDDYDVKYPENRAVDEDLASEELKNYWKALDEAKEYLKKQ